MEKWEKLLIGLLLCYRYALEKKRYAKKIKPCKPKPKLNGS